MALGNFGACSLADMPERVGWLFVDSWPHRFEERGRQWLGGMRTKVATSARDIGKLSRVCRIQLGHETTLVSLLFILVQL